MANGTIKIPLNKRQFFTVTGGPYRDKPDTMLGVKMAVEIEKEFAVNIPTKDFQTPDRLVLYRGLHKAIDLMLAGKPLYVGCMGGVGRTGLFLAVLVKAFGIKKPVEYVRANYMAHAVETDAQKLYVKKFTITPRIRQKIKRLRRWSWLRFWKTNLTRMPVQSVAQKDELNEHLKTMYPGTMGNIERVPGSSLIKKP